MSSEASAVTAYGDSEKGGFKEGVKMCQGAILSTADDFLRIVGKNKWNVLTFFFIVISEFDPVCPQASSL